jgi:hypothetical protein
MQSIRNIKLSETAVPLGPVFDSMVELRSIPGHKTVLLWSDFRWSGPDTETLAAVGRIKEAGQIDLVIVYGDTDDRGYQLAQNLARFSGGDQAWDGCQILADQNYFQSFIRKVLRTS